MQQKLEIDLLKSAKMRAKSGDYDSALQILDKIIAENEDSKDAYFNMATIFHSKGDIGKAIKSLHKVIELDPKNTDAAISLSVLLNDIGKYEEAKLVFEKANQNISKNNFGVQDNHINRKFSFKHYELGEMYYSYERYEEALFEYNKAIGLEPNNPEIYIKISQTYYKKGFVEKAFEVLRKLKNEMPSLTKGRVALGLLYFQTGKIIEARNEWQSVLTIDPNNSEAKMYLMISDNANEIKM